MGTGGYLGWGLLGLDIVYGMVTVCMNRLSHPNSLLMVTVYYTVYLYCTPPFSDIFL